MTIRSEHDLKTLARDGVCRVLVYASPCIFPVSFASHTWFVVLKEGVVTRWEVLHTKNACKTSWNYLHKDALPPLSGMWVFPYLRALHWPGTLIAHIEGSKAKEVCEFLEETPRSYPFMSTYHLWGPNSNSFTAWVLRRCKELQVPLPWNAFGKDDTRIFCTYFGTVIGGSRKAAALGFPTVNIPLLDTDVSGSYAALVMVEGKEYPGVAYADVDRRILEAHLFDFSGDLYGKEITVTLQKKIRDSEKFESEDALQKAVAADVALARAHFTL